MSSARWVTRVAGVVSASMFAVMMAPIPAHAQTSIPGPSTEASETSTEEAPDPSEPGAMRGRTREPTADEVLLWIPRVILFPLHLVTEYVLRVPVIAFLTWAERNRVFPLLRQVFEPTPGFSWWPTVSLEANVFIQPGLRLRWRNMGVRGHTMRLGGTFAGDDFWSASLRDEWVFEPVYFGALTAHSNRPDRAFHGLGSNSTRDRVSFREARTDVLGYVGLIHENHVRFEVAAGWSQEVIGPGWLPSIDTSPASIAALGLGPFSLFLVRAMLRLDSRRRLEDNGGVRLLSIATHGLDTIDAATQFLTVEVDVEAAVEVAYPDRVLAARIHVGETAALAGGPVPFLHLATLGWANHQGFTQGRFRGEAALLAEVRYRYPVQYFLDLQWTVSVGNVFARDLSDFSVGALTGSLGVGLRTRRTGIDTFEAMIAVGTTRFDSNFAVDGVRFYVSTTEGL